MKTLKKQIVIIGIFFISLLTASSLSATEYTILTPDNIEEIVADIVNTHGQGQGDIFRIEVYNFLADQLNSKSTTTDEHCPYMLPTVTSASYGENISFSWFPGLQAGSQRKSYQINFFNLSDFSRRGKTTERNSIDIKIGRAYYIFSFIANCGPNAFTSAPTIVIADKDIFLTQPNNRQGNGVEHISNWSISPNPFNQEIAIQLQANKVDRLNILLYDLNGRVVRNIQTITSIDPQSFFLSTHDLVNGFYTLSIETPTERLQQKLIKIQ